jgi:hypothetical protein
MISVAMTVLPEPVGADQTNLGNTGRQFLSALIDHVELIGAQLQPARLASVLRLLHLLFRERHHLARSKRRDHVSLIAPGMAVHENLVALFVDGETRLVIVVYGAVRHPSAADFAATEGLGDWVSRHGAPDNATRAAGCVYARYRPRP